MIDLLFLNRPVSAHRNTQQLTIPFSWFVSDAPVNPTTSTVRLPSPGRAALTRPDLRPYIARGGWRLASPAGRRPLSVRPDLKPWQREGGGGGTGV